MPAYWRKKGKTT
jgi:hypothetical protein